jgi:predicted ATPase
MITHVEVDGFKSLTSFRLSFHPGLNILVGPNGSGKTNIVSFFEYLADLMEGDASEATSRVGGAGAVFRRVGETYTTRIGVQIAGCVHAPQQPVRARHGKQQSDEQKRPYYVYTYSFSLLFPESRDTVLFESQRLRFSRVKHFVLRHRIDEPNEGWGVDIQANVDEGGTLVAKVNALEPGLLEVPYYPGPRKTDPKQPNQWLEEALTRLLSANNSLIAMVSRFTPELWPLATDLSGGKIYNVVPSAVKLPEDSAKPPGIARDGSGLAATLYALQRSKYPEEFTPWYYVHRPAKRGYQATAIDQLKDYLRLVNSTIKDINVFNDPFDNQLRVRFQVHSGEYEATLPLSLMSDGTLKWIALVTAALTARSVFSIEEPENYLHPQMQGQIVAILREILFGTESERFTLMTTHSETLLNHCTPEELVITSMVDGRTVAKRCQNAVEVSDEIMRTGFGLGYYYLTNALHGD